MENSVSFSSAGEAAHGSSAPEFRYSLPALLLEVKRDRASAAFAMEKLDQHTINLLFERELLRRDAGSNQ